MLRRLAARWLATPEEMIGNAALLLQDDCVRALGPRDAVPAPPGASSFDYGDAILAPGLVDVHVHGGAGVDVMSSDAAAFAHLRHHLARHGVTSFLATTVTAPWPDLLAAVERLGRLGADIHLEGPFLSPLRRGVHSEAGLLAPTVERLQELWQCSAGRLRLITLAPELPSAGAFIAAATRLGIRVSLGHSDATLDQARAAVAQGACHVTHTFNAMRPLHQREPGLLGLALAEPGLSAEIIADGIHVHPDLVKLFLRAKAPGKAVLVTDAISATGQGDGAFPLGDIRVRVHGGCCMADGHLAGSVLTLDQALRHVRTWAVLDWPAALRLASLNPADLLGWQTKGRLQPGASADVAVFSPDGGILATYSAGKLEFGEG